MKKTVFLAVAIGVVFALSGCQQPTAPQPQSHTITFNANGGTGTMQPQTIVSGVTVALTANAFTRVGYSFAGWATSASGSAAYVNGASYTMGNVDVTLYAVWATSPSYTITFNANGGTGTMQAQTIVSGLSANLTANSFTRAGFSFAGWATSTAGSVAYANGASYTMGSADVTLYAVWTNSPSYTITFNANGGAGSMTAQSIVSGLSANLTANSFTRAGMYFAGWATSASGSVEYSDGASYTMGTVNVTLYAIWSTSPCYTITFNENGGSGTMSAQSIVSGLSANLHTNSFTRTGYSFSGWATSASGSVAYANGASYTMCTANVMLYAKWTINPSYTITFNANGGTGSMTSQSIVSGLSANLTANSFTRAGFSFAGWATSASGSVAYADGASYPMGGANVTLYAKWTANTYTITFSANGGTGTMATQSIVSGSSANLTANAFTRADYVFNGWATTPTGTGVYMDSTAYLMGTENVNLYAIWETGTPGLAYTLINGNTEYSVSHGTVTTGALIIPAYYNTKRVVAINSSAFSGCSGLTGTLTIPNSVNSIGASAFKNCSGLNGNLTIPSGVTYIGNEAFRACVGFTGTLTIPSCVTSIGEYAFYNCSGLTGTLTIPSGVTSIDPYAFFGCSGLTGSLTVPSSVTSIGHNAFLGCSGFTGSLTISSGVISIGNAAFAGCSGFTGNLTIPSGVISIGAAAFYNCSGFTGSLTIPNSVTSIGVESFYGCSGLTGSLTIPSGVTSIEDNAFRGCSGLTGTLTISSSVTSIGYYAFYGCSGLTGTLTIPSGVTSIDPYAFFGCSGLTGSLTIPSGVTSIGDAAFCNCSGLTGSLTIPSGVTSIGNTVYAGCSGLTGTLTIPPGVTSIGNSAFYNCTGLTTAVVNPTTPPTITSSIYLPFASSGITSIAVPSDSVNAYKTAPNWSSYASMIVSQ